MKWESMYSCDEDFNLKCAGGFWKIKYIYNCVLTVHNADKCNSSSISALNQLAEVKVNHGKTEKGQSIHLHH